MAVVQVDPVVEARANYALFLLLSRARHRKTSAVKVNAAMAKRASHVKKITVAKKNYPLKIVGLDL